MLAKSVLWKKLYRYHAKHGMCWREIVQLLYRSWIRQAQYKSWPHILSRQSKKTIVSEWLNTWKWVFQLVNLKKRTRKQGLPTSHWLSPSRPTIACRADTSSWWLLDVSTGSSMCEWDGACCRASSGRGWGQSTHKSLRHCTHWKAKGCKYTDSW